MIYFSLLFVQSFGAQLLRLYINKVALCSQYRTNDSLTEVRNRTKKFFFNYVFVDCNKSVIQVMNGENGSALIINLQTKNVCV